VSPHPLHLTRLYLSTRYTYPVYLLGRSKFTAISYHEVE
jgi:hypothetical protein